MYPLGSGGMESQVKNMAKYSFYFCVALINPRINIYAKKGRFETLLCRRGHVVTISIWSDTHGMVHPRPYRLLDPSLIELRQ